MKPADRIKPRLDAIEQVGKRTLHAKTYREFGLGRFRFVISREPLHYIDLATGKMEEVDLTPVERSTEYVVDKAMYSLRVSKTWPEIGFIGRTGRAMIRLQSINSLPLNISTAVVDGKIRFDDIAPGFDLSLIIEGSRVRWLKSLKSALAPRTVTWEISKSVDSSFDITHKVRGADAENHRAEIEIVKSAVEIARQTESWTITETFTGRVSVARGQSRLKFLTEDVAYPVLWWS